MAQAARNLTDPVDGFLRDKKEFVVDRDTECTEPFLKTLGAAGVGTVRTAVLAPNMNAIAERFVKAIKEGCLSRMVFFGEGMLRKALAEFVEHYHTGQPPGIRQSTVANSAVAASYRWQCASQCAARRAAQLPSAATQTKGWLSPARQSGAGDQIGFAAAVELPVRTGLGSAAEPVPEWTARLAFLTGISGVRLLGQRGRCCHLLSGEV